MKFLLTALITLDIAAPAVGTDPLLCPNGVSSIMMSEEMIGSRIQDLDIYDQELLQKLSPRCAFTTQLLDVGVDANSPKGGNDALARPVPVADNCGVYNFAANQAQFDAYDNGCNGLGGQTITIDYEMGVGCQGFHSLLNYPGCLGGGCDQADFDAMAEFIKKSIFSLPLLPENCKVKTTVTTDGEGNEIDISNECLDGMINIWMMSEFYDGYPFIVMDPDTGLFNCDTETLANLTSLCSDKLGGHMVSASVDYEGPCIDLTSVPVCVSNLCNDREADLFHNLLSLGGADECTTEMSKVFGPFKVPESCKAPEAPKSTKEAYKGSQSSQVYRASEGTEIY